MSFTTETSTHPNDGSFGPHNDHHVHAHDPRPFRRGPAASTTSLPPEAFPRVASLCYLAAIEHRPVDWLWQDRLAAGTVSVLSGAPGAGKTWVALAIAAALSKGLTPSDTASTPDASRAPCNVLYASAEYLGSELICPRFISLGGDPRRLILVRGVISAADTLTLAPLSLYDSPMIEEAIVRTRARLLIIDPMHSFLSAGGRHRAHETARLFDNLALLAEENRCCILLVRHLRRRGRGHATIELSGAARTEFLVGSSPDAPECSALVQTKSNLGPLADSLAYRIRPGHDPAFQWTGPSNLTMEDLHTDRLIGAGLPQRKLAAKWLAQQLAGGPLSEATIERLAQRDGFALITIRRAKWDMGILSAKDRPGGAWSWKLPQEPTPTHVHVGKESQHAGQTQGQPKEGPEAGAGKTEK